MGGGASGGPGVSDQEPAPPKPVLASPRGLERLWRVHRAENGPCGPLEGASHTMTGSGPQGLEWFPINLLLKNAKQTRCWEGQCVLSGTRRAGQKGQPGSPVPVLHSPHKGAWQEGLPSLTGTAIV